MYMAYLPYSTFGVVFFRVNVGTVHIPDIEHLGKLWQPNHWLVTPNDRDCKGSVP